MASSSNRPSHYRGKGQLTTAASSHHIQELLPAFLEHLGKIYHNRPDLVMAAWPEVIGKELAPMTEAVSFVDGILTVKVPNSTLYSLLSQQDKPRILKNLRDKFAGTVIKTIHFRRA